MAFGLDAGARDETMRCGAALGGGLFFPGIRNQHQGARIAYCIGLHWIAF